MIMHKGLRESGKYEQVIKEVKRMIQETQQDQESGTQISVFI